MPFVGAKGSNVPELIEPRGSDDGNRGSYGWGTALLRFEGILAGFTARASVDEMTTRAAIAAHQSALLECISLCSMMIVG